ncbi:D-2-hydroxyacid dehydrogenase [Natronoglomus mannanivorans]|uniref:D-2-hydroxyacid dehydrogenase n=1 Tax=Natronoglomus mannanivorans TaxID=2979990 RepID=A0AAP2Z3S0_9EURY|nr:D-2-hydroxyacid dehydrogenase [Halobacteria archaeon AArc-xg1-1]
MPSVLVHHDLPIAKRLEGRRDDLTVVPASNRDEALEALPQADVFVVNPTNWTDDYVSRLTAGDWVQATSAGYARFPVSEFRDQGVILTNASGNYDAAVADHAMSLLLALSRRLPAFVDRQRRREWGRELGGDLVDLAGRTLTVCGLGNIGEAVARRALAFEMDVYGVKRDPADYDGHLSADRVLSPERFQSILEDTDVLVLTVPLTDDTHGLVDRDVLEALPESAFLVNVARGEIVDERALIDALEAGTIAGAGLDVFAAEPLSEDSPLWAFDETVVTPHVAGRSESFVDRFVDLFVRNYDRWRAGEPLENQIC